MKASKMSGKKKKEDTPTKVKGSGVKEKESRDSKSDPPLKRTRKDLSKWKDRYYVILYELAKSGLSNTKISQAMGITVATLKRWIDDKPALRFTFRRARDSDDGETGDKKQTFSDYVYKQLPPELQDLWDKINRCEKEDMGIMQVESLLQKSGTTARQHLFLYALVHYNFNPSQALRKVNLTKRTLDKWCQTEPKFYELLNEIHFHKKNFFEEHLVKLVKHGNPSAVLFANKSINEDRGYGEKRTVEINGQIQHNHLHSFDLGKLDLSLEIRKGIMDAIQNQKEKDRIEADKKTIQIPYKFADDEEFGLDLEREPKDGVMETENGTEKKTD